jgi:hypothetical protein
MDVGEILLSVSAHADVSRDTHRIAKAALCMSGWWYILGCNCEVDDARRRGLCGMV